MLFGFGLGVFVGGVVIGWTAHKRPEWFARVVSAANKFDDKANEVIKTAAAKAEQK